MERNITLIVNTYNNPDKLRTTLASIATQAQVIVLDDGSTDDMKTVVDEFVSPRLIFQVHTGLAGQIYAAGLANVNTSHVAWITAGDTLTPRAIWDLNLFMAGRPLAMVFTDQLLQGTLPWNLDITLNPETMSKLCVVDNLVVMQKQALLEVEGFDLTAQHFPRFRAYYRLYQRYEKRCVRYRRTLYFSQAPMWSERSESFKQDYWRAHEAAREWYCSRKQIYFEPRRPQ